MTSGFERIDHLNLDAIVAYADGEMGLVAYQRAAAHVERCPQCNAEVTEQIAARSWLRSANAPTIPLGLLDTLKSIPAAVPPTTPAPGLSIDPGTGRAYRTSDSLRSGHNRGRLFRFGAGALNTRSTRSAGRGASSEAIVVRLTLPRTAPASPSPRMRRPTWSRPTSVPSRRRACQSLRAPYTA